MPYVTHDDVATQEIPDFSEEEFSDIEEEIEFLRHNIKRDYERLKQLKGKTKVDTKKYSAEDVQAILAKYYPEKETKRPRLTKADALVSLLTTDKDHTEELKALNKI